MIKLILVIAITVVMIIIQCKEYHDANNKNNDINNKEIRERK